MSDGALNYALSLSGASAFAGALGTASGAVGGFIGKITALAAPLAGITAGVGALGAVMHALKEAAKMESLAVSFEVLAGSTEKAAGMLGRLRDVAAATPYEFGDLTRGSQTMMAFGVSTDTVIPLVERLGDIGKGSADQLGSLALATGQVAAAGRLTGQELIQFINAGFNPLQEIAEKTGISMSTLRDRMEKGEISFTQIEAAIKSATSQGGRFFQMMEKMSRTPEGMVGRLRDEINQAFIAFGKPINDALKPVLEDAIEKVADLKPMIETMGETVATAIRRSYEAATTGRLSELIKAEIHNAGDSLSILYSAATTGKLGPLVKAELELGAMHLANKLSAGLNRAMNGLSDFGKFLADSMEGVGSILKGHLISAGQAFAGFMIERVGGNLANILELVPFAGTAAANLRTRSAHLHSKLSGPNADTSESDKAIEVGRGMLGLAVDAMVRAVGSGQAYSKEELLAGAAERNKIIREIEAETAARSKSRAALHADLDAKNKGFQPVMPALPGGDDPGAMKKAMETFGGGAEGASADGAAAADAEASKTIRLFNLKDSALRRAARMSKADREGSGLDYLKGKGLSSNLNGPSALDYLKGKGITDALGGGLAEGAQAAREAGATINPKARALGETNRAGREKPDTSRDLASILRKIEENTAAFAEVALAT